MLKRSVSDVSIEIMPLRQYKVSLSPVLISRKNVNVDDAVGGSTELLCNTDDEEDDDKEVLSKRIADVKSNFYKQIFEQIKGGKAASDDICLIKKDKSHLCQVLNSEAKWKFENVLEEKEEKLFVRVKAEDRVGTRRVELLPVRLWCIHAPKNEKEYCDCTLNFKEYSTLNDAAKDRRAFEKNIGNDPRESYLFGAVIDSSIFDKIDAIISKQGDTFEQFIMLLSLLSSEGNNHAWSEDDMLEFRKMLVVSEIGFNESTKQFVLFQKGRNVFQYLVFKHFSSIFTSERLTNFCEVLKAKGEARLVHNLNAVGSSQWLDVILYSFLDSNAPKKGHLLEKNNNGFELNSQYDKRSKDRLVKFNQIWIKVREFFLPNVNTEKAFNTTYNLWLAGMLGFKIQNELMYKMLTPEGSLQMSKDRFNQHIGEYLRLIDPNFNLGMSENRQQQFKGADEQILTEASNEITYIYEPYYTSWMRNLHSLFCSVDVAIKVKTDEDVPDTNYFYVDNNVPRFRVLGLPTVSGFKSSDILDLNDIDLQIWMSLWMQSQLGLRQDELFNKTVVLPARKDLKGDDNLVQTRRVSIFNTGKSSLLPSNDEDRAIIRQIEELREKVKYMVWRQELLVDSPLYTEKVNELHSLCDKIRNESGGRITYIQEKPILSPDTTIDEVLDCVYRFILTKPKPNDAYANILANQQLKRRPNFDDVEARLGGLRWTPIEDSKNQRTRFKFDGHITTHNLRALYSTYSYYLYAPPRIQELSWIVKQLGHSSQQTLTTAVRYNSRRVWTSDNLKMSLIVPPIQTLVHENLEVIDDKLEEDLPDVEVTRNNDQTPILMKKFKHDKSISFSYTKKEVSNKYRLQSAQENLFTQMTEKDVELTSKNFRSLGYSKTHSYRIVQEAKIFLKIQ